MGSGESNPNLPFFRIPSSKSKALSSFRMVWRVEGRWWWRGVGVLPIEYSLRPGGGVVQVESPSLVECRTSNITLTLSATQLHPPPFPSVFTSSPPRKTLTAHQVRDLLCVCCVSMNGTNADPPTSPAFDSTCALSSRMFRPSHTSIAPDGPSRADLAFE